jgi:hypothetical protein
LRGGALRQAGIVDTLCRTAISKSEWRVSVPGAPGGVAMRNVGLSLAVILSSLVLVPPALAELKPGDKLDQSNWQEAHDLLPPEVLQHYKNGKFVSPIGKMVAPYELDQSFKKATEENAGKFKISDKGSVVLASTGEVPEYNFGAPFPQLDPNDPQIAEKIIWNYEYAYWSNGSNRLSALLVWLSGDSQIPERQISLLTMAKVYEGSPHRVDNPSQYSRLDRNFLLEPADIHGTASLGWRYKDPDKRDQVWAFVPALRRVRAVSPANRSDGVSGSEMTQDDGFNGFDAKPEDFTYKLVGHKDELMSFSPQSLDGSIKFHQAADGQGWTFETPLASYGFRQPGWSGLPWCPLESHLVARPTWFIEATPKDRYYLFGKIKIGIDRETYKVSNVVKYDWKGQPVGVFNRAIAYGQAPNGYRYVQITGGGQGGSFSENLKYNRATTGEALPGASDNEVDAAIDVAEFQPERLVQLGR